MGGPEGASRFEKKYAANAEELHMIHLQKAKDLMEKEKSEKEFAIQERAKKLEAELEAKI